MMATLTFSLGATNFVPPAHDGNDTERRHCGCGAAEELAPAQAGAGGLLLFHSHNWTIWLA